MTDRPPTGETAEDLLTRARALFHLADQELVRGISEHGPDGDRTGHLWRAQTYAHVGTLAARIAHAMNGVEHLGLLREFEERVDARTVSENGQPGAFPCPDCGYVASSTLRLDDHLVAAHSSDADERPPYTPPTLSGPYDPDRTHDR